MNFDHKIFPLESLKDIKFDKTKKVVLAGGCFDILHYGHVSFMQKAKTAGETLILLLESDEFITQVKKKKPVHTQQQRAEILAALAYVDYVILLPLLKNPNTDYENIIKVIHPSVIAITSGDSIESQKKKLAQTVNAELLIVPYLSSFSSSQLITYAPIFRD
ncbi:MAG: adenylyltransferase/cytidyltransferase family protein [Candidatus Roizmanbacteria bacterium]|nr:adenylyltransferase/cytidyltransferase family protein [Candidatus Roizmanbacteria bacterium]